jgi:hypothetical protein
MARRDTKRGRAGSQVSVGRGLGTRDETRKRKIDLLDLSAVAWRIPVEDGLADRLEWIVFVRRYID